MNSERPPPGVEYEREKERERRRLERILPELIKRIVETGYEKITEGPENVRHFVSEMKLPKEALALILAQLDETKNGLYRVVAKEIRDFLEHTNMAEEISKVLTTLSFEIKTEVRFIPNDSRAGAPKPEVRSRVSLRKDRSRASQPPPPPDDPPDDEPSSEGRRDRASADAERAARERTESSPDLSKSQSAAAASEEANMGDANSSAAAAGRYTPETEGDEEDSEKEQS